MNKILVKVLCIGFITMAAGKFLVSLMAFVCLAGVWESCSSEDQEELANGLIWTEINSGCCQAKITSIVDNYVYATIISNVDEEQFIFPNMPIKFGITDIPFIHPEIGHVYDLRIKGVYSDNTLLTDDKVWPLSLFVVEPCK